MTKLLFFFYIIFFENPSLVKLVSIPGLVFRGIFWKNYPNSPTKTLL